MPDGSRRYTTCSNGGPIFVYVKDGKILRTTPIDFDDSDAPSWDNRGSRKDVQRPNDAVWSRRTRCR